jgi:hypothetical protein
VFPAPLKWVSKTAWPGDFGRLPECTFCGRGWLVRKFRFALGPLGGHLERADGAFAGLFLSWAGSGLYAFVAVLPYGRAGAGSPGCAERSRPCCRLTVNYLAQDRNVVGAKRATLTGGARKEGGLP